MVSMDNNKDGLSLSRYTEYITSHEDADYVGYFLSLKEEEQIALLMD